MEYKIGDKVELSNGKISSISFVGETLEGYIVYGCGANPTVVVSLENIVKRIED